MGLFNHLFKNTPPHGDEKMEEGLRTAPSEGAAETPVAPRPDPTVFLHPKAYVPRGGGAAVLPGARPAGPAGGRSSERKPSHPAPPVSGEIILTLGDVLSRIPTQFLKSGPQDAKRELRFKICDLSSDIARGRAVVPLSRIAALCPDIFQKEVTAAEDMDVRLPLQKLVEQIGLMRSNPPAPLPENVARSTPPEASPPLLPTRVPAAMRTPAAKPRQATPGAAAPRAFDLKPRAASPPLAPQEISKALQENILKAKSAPLRRVPAESRRGIPPKPETPGPDGKDSEALEKRSDLAEAKSEKIVPFPTIAAKADSKPVEAVEEYSEPNAEAERALEEKLRQLLEQKAAGESALSPELMAPSHLVTALAEIALQQSLLKTLETRETQATDVSLAQPANPEVSKESVAKSRLLGVLRTKFGAGDEAAGLKPELAEHPAPEAVDAAPAAGPVVTELKPFESSRETSQEIAKAPATSAPLEAGVPESAEAAASHTEAPGKVVAPKKTEPKKAEIRAAEVFEEKREGTAAAAFLKRFVSNAESISPPKSEIAQTEIGLKETEPGKAGVKAVEADEAELKVARPKPPPGVLTKAEMAAALALETYGKAASKEADSKELEVSALEAVEEAPAAPAAMGVLQESVSNAEPSAPSQVEIATSEVAPRETKTKSLPASAMAAFEDTPKAIATPKPPEERGSKSETVASFPVEMPRAESAAQQPDLKESEVSPAGVFEDPVKESAIPALLHPSASPPKEVTPSQAQNAHSEIAPQEQESKKPEPSAAAVHEHTLKESVNGNIPQAESAAPLATEPIHSEIDPRESGATRSEASAPLASAPEPGKPLASELEASKPVASAPEPGKPLASKPEASKPVASAPGASKPLASEPEASKPLASTPEPGKPVASALEASKPLASAPEPRKPLAGELKASKPLARAPEASKPVASELKASKPVARAPEPGKPKAADLEASQPVANTPDLSKPLAGTLETSKPVASVPEAGKPAPSAPEPSKPIASPPEASKPVGTAPEASIPVAGTPAPRAPDALYERVKTAAIARAAETEPKVAPEFAVLAEAQTSKSSRKPAALAQQDESIAGLLASLAALAKSAPESAADSAHRLDEEGPMQGARRIRLSLPAILKNCPKEIFAGALPPMDSNLGIELPFAQIEPQLASGAVEISSLRFIAALPPGYMQYFVVREDAKVSIPMEEILRNLPESEREKFALCAKPSPDAGAEQIRAEAARPEAKPPHIHPVAPVPDAEEGKAIASTPAEAPREAAAVTPEAIPPVLEPTGIGMSETAWKSEETAPEPRALAAAFEEPLAPPAAPGHSPTPFDAVAESSPAEIPGALAPSEEPLAAADRHPEEKPAESASASLPEPEAIKPGPLVLNIPAFRIFAPPPPHLSASIVGSPPPPASVAWADQVSVQPPRVDDPREEENEALHSPVSPEDSAPKREAVAKSPSPDLEASQTPGRASPFEGAAANVAANPEPLTPNAAGSTGQNLQSPADPWTAAASRSKEGSFPPDSGHWAAAGLYPPLAPNAPARVAPAIKPSPFPVENMGEADVSSATRETRQPESLKDDAEPSALPLEHTALIRPPMIRPVAVPPPRIFGFTPAADPQTAASPAEAVSEAAAVERAPDSPKPESVPHDAAAAGSQPEKAAPQIAGDSAGEMPPVPAPPKIALSVPRLPVLHAPLAPKSDPEIPAPESIPPPPPLPLVRFNQDALQTLFMTDESLDLAAVCRHVSTLPGIQACVLSRRDENVRAGEMPSGFEFSELLALAPGVTQVAGRLPIGALKHFTLYAETHSVSFFERHGVCLCVVHRARSFLPGVREKLVTVADELSKS